MTDITAITAILGSLKTATEIAKFFLDSNLSLEKADIKLKMAELINALAEAKVEAADFQRLILAKDEKIKKLEDTLSIKQNLRYEAPYYWLDVDTKQEGPFCQTCYDSNEKLIRLQERKQGDWQCKVCKTFYRDSSYKFPESSGDAVKRFSR